MALLALAAALEPPVAPVADPLVRPAAVARPERTRAVQPVAAEPPERAEPASETPWWAMPASKASAAACRTQATSAPIPASKAGVSRLGWRSASGSSSTAESGVAEAAYNCLAAITGDSCDSAHDTAAQACFNSVQGNLCAPADPTNAPSSNCTDLNNECPAITVTDCQLNLDLLTDLAGGDVLTCYQSGTGACDQDFFDCLLLP